MSRVIKRVDIFNCQLRPGSGNRRPQREPIRFWPILPMKLKNSVSSKSERATDSMCLQEMSLMLACLKRNEFDQSVCSKEIQEFSKCTVAQMEQRQLRLKQNSEGFVAAGEKKLPVQQLNRYLEKHQQPK
ncbi:small ribosomal subunit protein mS37-like [Artemia franciscana]|uniref:CHCH domain-containing protein n=1 Tax=Artemia franciscana TaxID=6661 RepID=A0AA88L686_ARTSF|nr:hypothetical protein QYM36_005744 [Artemia franciscana]